MRDSATDIAPAARRPRPDARAPRHDRAFSLVELLVSLAVVALLTAMVVAAVAKVRQSARSTACLSNLGEIAKAFHLYALENGGRLPDPQASGTSWEATLRAYLTDPGTFRCPADGEIGPAVGSSYDWRDTGVAATTLAGQPMGDVSRFDLVLAFESLPGWHAKRRMNVAHLDGSCATADDQAALSDLMRPVR